MQKVLITGGAGFIGFHLAKALVHQCEQLVLCDNLSRGQVDAELKAFLDKNSNVELITGDLTQPATYGKLGEAYDTVFHFAATLGVEIVEKDPEKVIRNNILNTLCLLDWFVEAKCRNLLFSSSSEVYADGVSLGFLPVPTSEKAAAVVADPSQPRSSYAISKLVGEHLAAQYGQRHKFDFTVIRYHNIYGPRMGAAHVIPQMVQRLSAGENPLTVRSPGHTRAFCYVDDAVRATLALSHAKEASRRVVHVGNDLEEISILDLTSLLCQAMGMKRELKQGLDQSGSVSRRCPNIDLLRKLTGFQPQVSLKDGLGTTVRWYQKHLLKKIS